jgi:hypothetical protein
MYSLGYEKLAKRARMDDEVEKVDNKTFRLTFTRA